VRVEEDRHVAKLGVTMPGLNQPIDAFPAMARAAEDAGFDSVWDYEFYRNPFVIHGMTAQATSTITLGTGLAAAAGRSPFEMANAAADVDETSEGRLLLGMSIGGGGFAELVHGASFDHPAPRMKEFIEVMRLAWDWTAGQPVEPYRGRFHSFTEPVFNPFGRRAMARPRIPVYLGALRPRMCRLAGEVADGCLGYFLPPAYLRDVVIPNVAEGARRAGRDPAEIDIASETVCSVSPDRAEAYRRARYQVGIYIAAEVSIPMAEQMGLAADREACLQALMAGGPEALQDAVSDKLVEAFSITGTPDEAREQLRQFDDCLPHVLLHPPYMPVLSAEETADAYYNILTTFGR
jgi:5,10-methylenetetrahydromethanopterin reductase